MRILKKRIFNRNMVLASIGIVLLLVVMVVMVVSADETEPTWRPPNITKWATKSSLNVGDTVKFLITIKNPADPAPPEYTEVVTWYQVAAADVVADAFDVLATSILDWQGSQPAIVVSGNTVTATATYMEPGDWFVFEIRCGLVGPVEQGTYVTNHASVAYYEDESGDVGITYDSDDVSIFVGYQVMLPLVARNH